MNQGHNAPSKPIPIPNRKGSPLPSCDEEYPSFKSEDISDFEVKTRNKIHRDKRLSYQKGNIVGAGAFGCVYLAINKETGELFAIKEISFDTFPTALRDQKIQQIEQEVQLMTNISHENILKYHGMKKEEDHLNIFLEFVPGGSIRSVIKKFGPLGEKLIRKLTKQILLALDHLHDRNIVHGDIKGDNILVDLKSCVKLCDFGSSRNVYTDKRTPPSLVGTPNFWAPELLMERTLGFGTDIWALAATIVEMFSGNPPFSEHKTIESVMYQIGSLKSAPTIPDVCSSDAKDFLERCFIRNPKDRPSAKELLDHVWIKDFQVTFTNSSPIPNWVPDF